MWERAARPWQSLASVAADVLDYHEAALAEAGLTAKVVGDAHGAFDVPLLRRALSNLLGNATSMKDLAQSSRSTSRTTDEGRVLISVTNYGSTIDAEILRSCLIDFSAQILRAAMGRATMASVWP